MHAVMDALVEILQEQRHADKVIERVLKEDPRRGSRDRRFIAETIYDIVRWKRWYGHAAGNETPAGLLAGWLVDHSIPFPSWHMFSSYDAAQMTGLLKQPDLARAIRQSIPDWLDALGSAELGSRWENEIAALNAPAQVVLRANRLKTNAAHLIKRLREDDIIAHTVPGTEDTLVLEKRAQVFRTAAFQEGLFEMQDAASQQVAPFTQAEPGMRIIDACAGAGGKTLHLAARMQNKGRIIAMDTSARKLEELKKRARRAGATNIETRWIESSKTIKRLSGAADIVLLDVPCSGLGVLRRNPDTKWKLSADSIAETKKMQAEILDQYSAMARSGGHVIYATCSILPSENQRQVENFVARNPVFQLLEDKSLFPSDGTDGFYMARLLKNG